LEQVEAARIGKKRFLKKSAQKTLLLGALGPDVPLIATKGDD